MIALFCNLIVTTHDQILNWLDSWLTTRTSTELSGFQNRFYVDSIMGGKIFGLYYFDLDPNFRLLWEKPINNTDKIFWEFRIAPGIDNILKVNFIKKHELSSHSEVHSFCSEFNSRQILMKYDIQDHRCRNENLIIFPNTREFNDFTRLKGVESKLYISGSNVALKLNLNCCIDFPGYNNPLIKYYKIDFTFIGSIHDNIYRSKMPTSFTLTVVKEFNYLDAQFPIIKAYLGKYSTVAAAGTLLAAAITPIAFGCYFFLM